jgi:hypothetical protein
VLRPVFEFGEEDTGPREATDGNAAREVETQAEEPDIPETEEESDLPAVAPAEEPPPALTEARTLFSRALTDDPAAMTAMGTLPRGIRAGELCTTELREQLRNAGRQYWPDLLPSYRLPEGNVMRVREAAFRARGQWYALGFRCEIDDNAMRVLSFAFDIGAAIRREEWQARGFPEN